MHGINNAMKRRKIFHFCKRQDAAMYLLQEKFYTKEKNIWASECENRCTFANGT